MTIGEEYSRSSTSPDVSAPKQHSGPQACQPSCWGVAPAPEMIVASTIVTYSSLLRVSQPEMLKPFEWPQDAETLDGIAFSKASRTASVKVSIGVVVQFMCGAGSIALQIVPLGPKSTVTQR